MAVTRGEDRRERRDEGWRRHRVILRKTGFNYDYLVPHFVRVNNNFNTLGNRFNGIYCDETVVELTGI